MKKKCQNCATESLSTQQIAGLKAVITKLKNQLAMSPKERKTLKETQKEAGRKAWVTRKRNAEKAG